MNMQPLEVKNFSGGKTDNYLAGPPEKGQEFDNLLINKNQKPYSRWGSVIEDSTNYQISSGVKRISYLWDHRDIILRQSENHIYYIATTYPELVGPTSNHAFSGATQSSHVSAAFWNNHSLFVCDNFCKPQKVFIDGSSNLQLRNAGLPKLASNPTVTAGGAGTNNYIYAFHYYYTYSVEGVTFEDFGATVQVELDNALAPDASSVSITGIPVIANGTADNWDTSNIKVYIYRTEANQTLLKYIGQVTNGTTTYTDSASDATISTSTDIYTTGDVVDNDPPPPAKFVHIANNIAWYGYVKEGSAEVSTRVRQSIAADFDSCPESFTVDFPQEVTGINSIQGVVIVFCKNSVYRLDGFYDEQGRGGITTLRISDTVGCVSHDGIVQTDQGLFFAGNEGWYFCDGYKVMRISDGLNDTYKQFVDTATKKRNIWGAFDKNQRRIYWAVQSDSSSTDNDYCYILDLEWGLSSDMTFTTASNGANFNPTALLFKDNYMYRADFRGYVFRHDETLFSDPKVDISSNPSTWVKAAVIYNYKSCAYDFGTSFIRKFVPTILLTLSNRTNVSVQINSINDDGRVLGSLKELRYISNIVWGDPDVVWGDPNIIWNKLGLIEEKRMFPAKGLRCNYKQIQITNSNTIVTDSDLRGQGTVARGAKTVTLDNTNAAWPVDCVDMYISFANDNYTNQFLVLTRSSDTVIIVQDSDSVLPSNGSYKWELKGYKKNEAIEILSYVLHFKMLTPSQKSFHAQTDTGGNA